MLQLLFHFLVILTFLAYNELGENEGNGMRVTLPTLNLALNFFLCFGTKFVWGAKVRPLMTVNHHNMLRLFWQNLIVLGTCALEH